MHHLSMEDMGFTHIKNSELAIKGISINIHNQ